MYQVDINCDLGESFGQYTIGADEQILEYVTSANIACGFHAGDPTVMRKTVRMALDKGVKIGAHPGLQDLAGFGRRPMAISAVEAYDLVIYQIGALSAFLKAEGGTMQHVKPHAPSTTWQLKILNYLNRLHRLCMMWIQTLCYLVCQAVNLR